MAVGITPTQNERAEWARFAQAAYSSGRSAIGHRVSAAASKPILTCAEHDAVSEAYRQWLVFGWAEAAS